MSASVNSVTIGKWAGISYSCPACLSLLSVAIDPISLKADIIAGVAAELKPLKDQLSQIERKLTQMAQKPKP